MLVQMSFRSSCLLFDCLLHDHEVGVVVLGVFVFCHVVLIDGEKRLYLSI